MTGICKLNVSFLASIIKGNLMKKSTVFVILAVLIGLFATNFIMYQMPTNLLTIILSIITYIGSVLILVVHIQKKQVK
jgi:hypothetical protein